MLSLNLCYGVHYLECENLYDGVMKMYLNPSESGILLHYPTQVSFRGEDTIESGGVTRDLFSSFFDEMYRYFFEGSTLVTLSVHPGTSLEKTKVMGTIISHGYLVSGVLPIRVAFPCLAAILCLRYNESSIPNNILVDMLLDSFSQYDFNMFNQAKIESKSGSTSFSDKIRTYLTNMISFYGCRQLPSPSNFAKILVEIAKCKFYLKPAAAIQSLCSGIPEAHRSFWEKMSVLQLYTIYRAMFVSPEKVVTYIETNCEPENNTQERVLMYLRQYVGSLSRNSLCLFLRFVTGSYVFTGRGIIVTFNKLDGLARRPIAHTCGCTIELPVTYSTYTEFQSEMDGILKSQEVFVMSSL